MISVKQSLAIPQAEIDKHLEMGRLFLSKGQLQDALSHYHAAVDGDPHNYLTYFKRGTVYLALGKAKSAIADLDKVIELKPDFIAAKQQRANAFLKQGDLHLAKQDFIDIIACRVTTQLGIARNLRKNQENFKGSFSVSKNL
ncbi:DnaJ sub C member 3 [Homalodisca vitripennis]|nr:DnaJ sub C member 3 [Homalodisca vitripennis]